MAIKIIKPTQFGDGVTAEYWRIGVANIHPRSQVCQIVMDGYVNAAARNTGKAPAAYFERSIPWEAFSNDKNPNIRDIYLFLKAQEDWAAGEDV